MQCGVSLSFLLNVISRCFHSIEKVFDNNVKLLYLERKRHQLFFMQIPYLRRNGIQVGDVGFRGGMKIENPKKNPRSKAKTSNQLKTVPESNPGHNGER